VEPSPKEKTLSLQARPDEAERALAEIQPCL
jgi:hypothetical protein